ncbi:unnamed protein product [Adineta ricciae]|nr:unnamed protein product [Adineta ricciae]
MKYLNKFGYNPCANSSNNVACSVDYRSMLRDFQKQYGLKMSGILDELTKNEMNRPRCGLPDTTPVALHRWMPSHSTLTWSLRSYPRQIQQGRTRAIIQEAFDTWASHIPLRFKETCSTCPADFKIEVGSRRHNGCGDQYSFDGQGGVLAHAYYPQDGRIHFDADEFWIDAFDNSGVNFYLVAVHEIGHALGLDHNNDRGSIMFPAYNLHPRSNMLPNRDRESIKALYGSVNGDNGDCDGRRCGCYNGYCWAYVDAAHTNRGDWWCYTQKAGVSGKQGIWQTCSSDSGCSWDRTCGSCNQYKGFEEEKRGVC